MIMTEELKDEIIRYLVEYIKMKDEENRKSHNELIKLLRDAKAELVERGGGINQTINTRLMLEVLLDIREQNELIIELLKHNK